MMRRTKVLVTGGAGYIGSVLVPALLSEGYAVTVYDSLSFRQCSLLDCCADTGFDFVKGDICDTSTLGGLIAKHDVVLPLAAIVGAPACKANPTLTGMVMDSAIRLITITGLGGMGKTHLALGVAWQVAAGHFRDGVTFVPLAAEGTGEQVVAALAQALHLPLSTVKRSGKCW